MEVERTGPTPSTVLDTMLAQAIPRRPSVWQAREEEWSGMRTSVLKALEDAREATRVKQFLQALS